MPRPTTLITNTAWGCFLLPSQRLDMPRAYVSPILSFDPRAGSISQSRTTFPHVRTRFHAHAIEDGAARYLFFPSQEEGTSAFHGGAAQENSNTIEDTRQNLLSILRGNGKGKGKPRLASSRKILSSSHSKGNGGRTIRSSHVKLSSSKHPLMKSTYTTAMREAKEREREQRKKRVYVNELNATKHRPLLRDVLKALRASSPHFGALPPDDQKILAYAEIDRLIESGRFSDFVTTDGRLTTEGRVRIASTAPHQDATQRLSKPRGSRSPKKPHLPFSMDDLLVEVAAILDASEELTQSGITGELREHFVRSIGHDVWAKLIDALVQGAPIRAFYHPAEQHFTRSIETMAERLAEESLRVLHQAGIISKRREIGDYLSLGARLRTELWLRLSTSPLLKDEEEVEYDEHASQIKRAQWIREMATIAMSLRGTGTSTSTPALMTEPEFIDPISLHERLMREFWFQSLVPLSRTQWEVTHLIWEYLTSHAGSYQNFIQQGQFTQGAIEFCLNAIGKKGEIPSVQTILQQVISNLDLPETRTVSDQSLLTTPGFFSLPLSPDAWFPALQEAPLNLGFTFIVPYTETDPATSPPSDRMGQRSLFIKFGDIIREKEGRKR